MPANCAGRLASLCCRGFAAPPGPWRSVVKNLLTSFATGSRSTRLGFLPRLLSERLTKGEGAPTNELRGNTTMPNHCTSGHELDEGFAFCPTCGAARAADDVDAPASARSGAEVSATTPTDSDSSLPGSEAQRVLPPALPVAPSAVSGDADRHASRFAANRTVLLVAAGVVVLALVGILAVALGGTKHTITGEMTLMDSDGYDESIVGGCEGTGGYDDISYGTSVTVRDGAGEILATGSLEAGEDLGLWCNFPFTVEDVPGADFYEVEVSHRGGLSYSDKEMEEKDWFVSVSLGEPS